MMGVLLGACRSMTFRMVKSIQGHSNGHGVLYAGCSQAKFFLVLFWAASMIPIAALWWAFCWMLASSLLLLGTVLSIHILEAHMSFFTDRFWFSFNVCPGPKAGQRFLSFLWLLLLPVMSPERVKTATLHYPFVLQGFMWCHSLLGVPPVMINNT